MSTNTSVRRRRLLPDLRTARVSANWPGVAQLGLASGRMENPTPEAIVDSTLTTLVSCTRRRDLIGTLDLFVDDAALFGSDEGEFARGHDDLREFLTDIYALRSIHPAAQPRPARRRLVGRRILRVDPAAWNEPVTGVLGVSRRCRWSSGAWRSRPSPVRRRRDPRPHRSLGGTRSTTPGTPCRPRPEGHSTCRVSTDTVQPTRAGTTSSQPLQAPWTEPSRWVAPGRGPRRRSRRSRRRHRCEPRLRRG